MRFNKCMLRILVLISTFFFLSGHALANSTFEAKSKIDLEVGQSVGGWTITEIKSHPEFERLGLQKEDKSCRIEVRYNEKHLKDKDANWFVVQSAPGSVVPVEAADAIRSYLKSKIDHGANSSPPIRLIRENNSDNNMKSDDSSDIESNPYSNYGIAFLLLSFIGLCMLIALRFLPPLLKKYHDAPEFCRSDLALKRIFEKHHWLRKPGHLFIALSHLSAFGQKNVDRTVARTGIIRFVVVFCIASLWLLGLLGTLPYHQDSDRDYALILKVLQEGTPFIGGVTAKSGFLHGSLIINFKAVLIWAGMEHSNIDSIVFILCAFSASIFYAFCWQFISRSVAPIATFLYIFCLPDLLNCKYIWNPAFLPLPFTAWLYAVFAFYGSGHMKWLILAAISLAIAIDVHLSMVLLVPVLISFIAWRLKKPLFAILLTSAILFALTSLMSGEAVFANLSNKYGILPIGLSLMAAVGWRVGRLFRLENLQETGFMNNFDLVNILMVYTICIIKCLHHGHFIEVQDQSFDLFHHRYYLAALPGLVILMSRPVAWFSEFIQARWLEKSKIPVVNIITIIILIGSFTWQLIDMYAHKEIPISWDQVIRIKHISNQGALSQANWCSQTQGPFRDVMCASDCSAEKDSDALSSESGDPSILMFFPGNIYTDPSLNVWEKWFHEKKARFGKKQEPIVYTQNRWVAFQPVYSEIEIWQGTHFRFDSTTCPISYPQFCLGNVSIQKFLNRNGLTPLVQSNPSLEGLNAEDRFERMKLRRKYSVSIPKTNKSRWIMFRNISSRLFWNERGWRIEAVEGIRHSRLPTMPDCVILHGAEAQQGYITVVKQLQNIDPKGTFTPWFVSVWEVPADRPDWIQALVGQIRE